MSEELKKIAAEWALPVAVIVAVAIIKVTFAKARQNWKTLLRQLFVSLVFGLVAYKYMGDLPDEERITTGYMLVVTVMVAFQADYLAAAMMMLGHRMKEDPVGLVREIRDLVRGR